MSERRRRGYHPDARQRDWTRRQLVRRDGMMCGICQEPISSRSDVTIDHVVPVSHGGSDKLENLRLAHEECNRRRGAGHFAPPSYPRSWDEK